MLFNALFSYLNDNFFPVGMINTFYPVYLGYFFTFAVNFACGIS